MLRDSQNNLNAHGAGGRDQNRKQADQNWKQADQNWKQADQIWKMQVMKPMFFDLLDQFVVPQWRGGR